MKTNGGYNQMRNPKLHHRLYLSCEFTAVYASIPSITNSHWHSVNRGQSRVNHRRTETPSTAAIQQEQLDIYILSSLSLSIEIPLCRVCRSTYSVSYPCNDHDYCLSVHPFHRPANKLLSYSPLNVRFLGISLPLLLPGVLDWLKWTELVQWGQQHSQYHQSINVLGERQQLWRGGGKGGTQARQLGQSTWIHSRLHRVCGWPWKCVALPALGLSEWRW